ncbi:MAG: SpoIVB peptidase S55 domain-containing protein [Acidobacteriota bacterium]
MKFVRIAIPLALFLLGAVPANAQQVGFYPLDQVQPGMQGYGRTVFQGSKLERFGVEILGVLRNVGPKHNMILALLSGDKVEKTGVFAGMSGSPVYLEDQLVGAVAFSFPFSTAPIVGITPIHEMIDIFTESPRTRVDRGRPVELHRLYEVANLQGIPAEFELPRFPVDSSWTRGRNLGSLQPIATPLNVSGFTPRSIQQFASQLDGLGWVPVLGMGTAQLGESDDAPLEAGSTISVQLARGDIDISASGTVTHVSGNKVYAFGHPFMSIGYTDLPLNKASVLTVIPSLMTSQKVSATGKFVGSIRQDRATGIMGVIGEESKLVPVELKLRTSRNEWKQYRFELADDRFLTPFLMSLSVLNSIVASERSIGDQTLRVKSTILVRGQETVTVENLISDQFSGPTLAALAASAPVNFLLGSGFDDVDIEKIDVEITAVERSREAILEKVWPDRVEVKPGEEVQLTVFLRQSDGETVVKKYPVLIPAEMGPGPLKIVIADGASLEAADAKVDQGVFVPKDLGQLIRAINNLKKNDRLYIRLSRDGAGAVVGGEGMMDLPPSLLALYRSGKTRGETQPVSRVVYAEHELPATDFVLRGGREITVQVQ